MVHRSTHSASEIIIAGVIWLSTLLIFWFSPVHQITDSNYSMLLSQSLLDHHSFALDGYNIPRLPGEYHDHTWKNGNIHQIEWVGGHLYYYMPPGSSVLSLPYVAALKYAGISPANPDGTYNPAGEASIETSLAAILMATLALCFFRTSRLLLPIWWSIVISLGGALGTQVWSTASRGLWADTWGLLLLGAAIYLLVKDAVTGQIRAVWLATILSWMYFVRPTNSISILAVTAYLTVRHPTARGKFLGTGALWFLAFVVYSWTNFHLLLPHYFAPTRLSFGSFWVALAGNLVSPSRGLLVYVPVLLFIAYLVVRYWKMIRFHNLVYVSAAVILLFLIVISGFEPWWAGASFGPRYTAPLVPWFVLLAILSVDAMLRSEARQPSTALRSSLRQQLWVGGILLGLSIATNAIGATSNAAWMWNTIGNIDSDASKVWNLRYPQLLAPVLKPPLPAQFPIVHSEIDLVAAEADRFLWSGWSGPEPEFRWTDGDQAQLIFDLDSLEDTRCEIKLLPFLVPNKVLQQNVTIDLNGETIQQLQLRDNVSTVHEQLLPRRLLSHRNTMTFYLPDAASPRSFALNNDTRKLGIGVYWIRFRRQNEFGS